MKISNIAAAGYGRPTAAARGTVGPLTKTTPRAGLLNPAWIPQSGKKIESFIPRGWQLNKPEFFPEPFRDAGFSDQSHVVGRLNNVSTPVHAVSLIKEGDSGNRALLVLREAPKKDGGYFLMGVAERGLQDPFSGGMKGGPDASTVAFENGKLLLAHNGGSREMWSNTFTVAADKAGKSLKVVGLETMVVDTVVPEMDSKVEKYDLVTGIKTTTINDKAPVTSKHGFKAAEFNAIDADAYIP